MKTYETGKRKITAEQVVAMAKKNSKDITEEQAQEILDLLYVLAALEVKSYLKEKSSEQDS